MELHQISKHCYYSDPVKKVDQPVMALIAGPCETLAVDCGNGPGRSLWLLQQAKKLGLPPVRYAVLTHWHWDHVMGGRAMQETGVTLLATQGTARQRELCRLVGEDVTLQGPARRYAAAFGQEPDAEAVEELMAFVRGNIVQGR